MSSFNKRGPTLRSTVATLAFPAAGVAIAWTTPLKSCRDGALDGQTTAEK